MYNKQEMIKRIKEILKKKNITQSKMLSDCGMGKNALMRLVESGADDRDILLGSFVKIADYLDCSADFLLGRDDAFKVHANDKVYSNDTFDDELQMQKLEAAGFGAAAESAKRIVLKAPDTDTIIEINQDDFNA